MKKTSLGFILIAAALFLASPATRAGEEHPSVKSDGDMHMGALTLNIKGKNKLDAEWTSFENGQKKDMTRLTLTKEE
jgi:hypothetical protein